MKYERDVCRSQVVTYYYEPTKRENSTGIKRVAAYCRVSTLEEEQELSYETQRAYYENMIAKDPNMVLVKVYGDQGLSGLNTDKRVEFKQMVKDALDGKIDVIMVKSVSRFSRNSVDCLNILKQFKEKGIQVLFEKEGLDSLDPNSEMVLTFFSAFAQNESANISENMRWAYEYRNRSGHPCRMAPYGFRTMRQLKMKGIQSRADKKDQKGIHKHCWVIEPEEAERVQMMFELASQGFSITRIVEKLNVFEKSKRTEYVWSNQRVAYILRNEAYRGDVLTSKSVQPDYLVKKRLLNQGLVDQYYISDHHPALVEPEVFEKVQELMKNGVLFANRPALRQIYMEEHPEMELVGAEMHGTKRETHKVKTVRKNLTEQQPDKQ